MIRPFLILTLALFLSSSGPTTAWIHGSLPFPTAAVVCDITTGVATGVGAGTCIAHPATCNGVADDRQALIDLNSWATTVWQASHTGTIELFVPTGKICRFEGNTVACPNTGNFSCPFAGIANLFISGYGAQWNIEIFTWGSQGINFNGNIQTWAYTQTVAAGASCATLKTPADASLFTSGAVTSLQGFNLQSFNNGGGFGQPPSNFWKEWPDVQSVDATHQCDGVTSGSSVHFTAPIQYTYKSTWPLYDGGGVQGPSEGGPAILYQIDTTWRGTVYVAGLTVNMTNNPNTGITSPLRDLTFRDVSIIGSQHCFFPTQNKTFTIIAGDWSICNSSGKGIEVDKMIGTMTLINPNINGLWFQTSSVDLLTVSGGFIDHFLGTPKRVVAVGTKINSLIVGPDGYGRSDEFNCTGCNITTNFGTRGPSIGNWNGFGATCANGVNNPQTAYGQWSMSGGVITIPNNATACGDNVHGWAIPGTNIFFWGQLPNEDNLCQVADVTQDPTNTFVATTCSGGLPTTLPLDTNVTPNALYIQVHPMPKFTCSGCTGAVGAVLALQPAGSPLYSYAQCTFTGAQGAASVNCTPTWGQVSQININVTQAYGGAPALSFHAAQFDNWPTINSTLTLSNYGPIINAKTVGNRQITPSGGTICVSGTCTGDSNTNLPDATKTWLTQGTGSAFSADPSAQCPGVGCPSITLTVQTNQGVVNP